MSLFFVCCELISQQVDEMRTQIEIGHNAINEEREGRKAAEEEAGHLRDDLVALLGLANSEEMQSEIRLKAIQARENFQRKERSEIEDLKRALLRSLDELESSRNAEAVAEERASKANLQASLYEQEIVSTKTDLALLTEKMDEMKEAESSKRDSLEYRITSLQNDQEVLRRQHSAQLEKLQNELNHISMERDRLFQSLKESERSKEALLRAKSGRDAVCADEDTLTELSRLRLEKAQLLVATTEEGTQVERRIREARAADQSSAEADIILERNLRLAAEKALEHSKLEIAELRSEAHGAASDAHSLVRERALVTEMEMELDSLKAKVENMSRENKSLKEQLEGADRVAREKIERLSEDCRQARTRVCQLEREGRLAAEIQAEVSRLRAQDTNGNGSNRVAHHADYDDETNPAAEDEGRPEIVVGAGDKLYDIVQSQRQTSAEVSVAHAWLLLEHQHLLGVLSHQNLVRKALIAALGQATVDSAIEEAKEEAIRRDGEFLDLEPKLYE